MQECEHSAAPGSDAQALLIRRHTVSTVPEHITSMLHLTQLLMTKHRCTAEERHSVLKQSCYLKERLEEWPNGGRLLSVTPPRSQAKCGHKQGRLNKDDGASQRQLGI